MKKGIIIASLCLLALYTVIVFVRARAGIVGAVEVGSEALDFTLVSSNGEQVSLASFRNKSIVVMGVGDPYT